MSNDNGPSPLDELAVMHRLLAECEDLDIEELPDGTYKVTGTLEIPNPPGFLMKVKV